MPEITEIHRRGRTVTVAFNEGPPLHCDRQFLRTHLFAVGHSIAAPALEDVRREALRHEANTAALRWLAPRPRSRAEVEQRLRRRGTPADVIAATLSTLEAQGYLNDGAFAVAWTDERVRLRPRARRMIQAELRTQGVDAAIAEGATADVDDGALAKRLAQTRASRFAGTWDDFRRRGGGALRQRGFSFDVAEHALRAAWQGRPGGDDDDPPPP